MKKLKQNKKISLTMGGVRISDGGGDATDGGETDAQMLKVRLVVCWL